MKKELLKVSIRQSAIYLPLTERTEERKVLAPTTVALVAKLRKIGYSLSEELLHTVNQVTPTSQVEGFGSRSELGTFGERLGYTYRRNTAGPLDYVDCECF